MRGKRILVALVAAVLLGVASVVGVSVLTSTANAQSVHKSGDVIAQTEKVDGSFFAAGSTIQVTDSVNGDVYIGGQTVTVAGNVTGDVIVAGQNVTISGTVAGSVRVMAQTVTISGDVEGSVSALAQTLTIGDEATIKNDLAFAGQSVTINGTVGRDVTGAVERFHIGGSVGRDVHYTSEVALTKNQSATIGGEVQYTVAEQYTPRQDFGAKVSGWLYGIVALVFATLLVALIAPRWLRSATERAHVAPWKAMLAGFLGFVFIPFAIIVLFITIVGIPVAIALIAAYIVLIGLGYVFAAYYVGRLIFRNKQNTALQAIVGAIIYSALLLIPIVGFIAGLLGGLIGFGSVALDIAKRVEQQNTSKKK
ncbi:MAG: hypothetical protein ACREGE_03920 [Candidatus Microsaccharimonas sp.]